jgi:hypothetical protein
MPEKFPERKGLQKTDPDRIVFRFYHRFITEPTGLSIHSGPQASFSRKEKEKIEIGP